MRKLAALLSVALMLFAANCFTTCLVAQTAPAVPPCHQHHQKQTPCENHPGQLAFSAAQTSAHVDFVLPAFDAPLPTAAIEAQFSAAAAPQIPAFIRPPLIALRI